MEKKLRLLGLAAVISIAAILVAQQRISPSRSATQNGQGAPVASAQHHGFENTVLVLLAQYFSARQGYELDVAKNAGRDDLVQPIIKANCAANLTLLQPDEQKKVIAGWQIETYAPADAGWNEVVKTPTLVNALRKVSPESNQVAEEALAYVWDQPIRQLRDFDKELASNPQYQQAQGNDKIFMRNQLLIAFWARNPQKKIERAADFVSLYEAGIEKTLKQLTPDQRKELRMLVDRFERGMQAAKALR